MESFDDSANGVTSVAYRFELINHSKTAFQFAALREGDGAWLLARSRRL